MRFLNILDLCSFYGFCFRLMVDALTSEVKQLENSTQKLNKQVQNADDDLKEQFEEFIEVSALFRIFSSFQTTANRKQNFRFWIILNGASLYCIKEN